jgi:hypothetical protein
MCRCPSRHGPSAARQRGRHAQVTTVTAQAVSCASRSFCEAIGTGRIHASVALLASLGGQAPYRHGSARTGPSAPYQNWHCTYLHHVRSPCAGNPQSRNSGSWSAVRSCARASPAIDEPRSGTHGAPDIGADHRPDRWAPYRALDQDVPVADGGHDGRWKHRRPTRRKVETWC